jgi:hypothetical protein
VYGFFPKEYLKIILIVQLRKHATKKNILFPRKWLKKLGQDNKFDIFISLSFGEY